MRTKQQNVSAFIALFVFTIFAGGVFVLQPRIERDVRAQDTSDSATPTPTPAFDQKAAIAEIREEIKGKEKQPAGEVFKSIQNFKDVPAGRLLAIMEMGYARSLGVDCTHCHTPENWASEEKPAKQIARDMHKMAATINGELLPAIKAFEGRTGRDRPVVNCTTCHRGQVKPATNLPEN